MMIWGPFGPCYPLMVSIAVSMITSMRRRWNNISEGDVRMNSGMPASYDKWRLDSPPENNFAFRMSEIEDQISELFEDISAIEKIPSNLEGNAFITRVDADVKGLKEIISIINALMDEYEYCNGKVGSP